MVVEFFTDKRVVDTLDIVVTGCEAIISTALGGVGPPGAQLHNFDVAWGAIMGAFNIQPAQLGER